MKAIVNTAPGKLEWLELPTPEPKGTQVRIRTAACGICATDLEMIAGWDRTGFPAIPGHEWGGTVDAVGERAPTELLGRRCVGNNLLGSGREVGFECPGGYAEYFLTESQNVFALPDGFELSAAAVIEPLAVAVRGMNRLGTNLTGPAVVFGDGPIGLLMIQLLAMKGVQDITGIGGRDSRLHLAKELGANRTLNYHELVEPLSEAILQSSGNLFPLVVEASGSRAAINAATDIAAPSGCILILGDYGQTGRADFLWNHILHQEITLIASNASEGAWETAVDLATSGTIRLDILVTHRLPAREFEIGMSLIENRQDDVLKLVLEWQ